MATVQPATQAFEEFPRNEYPRADKLEGPALQQALTQQIDFYFSKQNLENDAYLVSQMNSQRFVPVDIICNFRKVRLLTEDRNLVLNVMRTQCKNLHVDDSGNMARSTWKMERTTLILRDIPASTNVAELQAIFEDAEHKPLNIRSDVGDTWLATFEGEDQCMETALYLSNKNFQGNPVRCRIKPATTVRGYVYPNHNQVPVMSQQQWAGDMMGQAPNYYPNMPYTPHQQYAPYSYNQNVMMQNAYTGPGAQMPQQWQQQPYTQHSPTNTHNPNQVNERRQRGTRPERQNAQPRDKRDRDDKGGRPAPANKGKGRNGERDQRFRNKGERGPQHAQFPMQQSAPALPGPMDFPALPPPKKQSSNGSNTHENSDFILYSREQMASIVSRLGAYFPKPNPDVHTSAVNRSEPLTETQILEPMPVMYPASPSPLLAAQPHHSSEMPMLDLNSYGNPYLPPDNIPPPMEFSAIVNSKPPPIVETKQPAKKPAEEKAVIKKSAKTTTESAPVKNLAAIVAAAEKEAATAAAAAAAAPTAAAPRTQTNKSTRGGNTNDRNKKADRREGKGNRSERGERGDNRNSQKGDRGDRKSSQQGGRTGNKYATKKNNTRNNKQSNQQNSSSNTSSGSSENNTGNSGGSDSPSKVSYAEMIRRSAASKAAAEKEKGDKSDKTDKKENTEKTQTGNEKKEKTEKAEPAESK